MAANVLTGIVNITAPGVVKTFDDIALRLKDQRTILKSLQAEYAKLNTSQLSSPLGKELAADIRVATSEIKRLEAGSVNSLGNIGSAATKGFSALRQFAYVLPGIGVAGILGGFSDLIIDLLSGADAFDKIDLAAGHFKNDMKDLNDVLSNFKSSLDFSAKLEKLGLELSGLTGNKLSAATSAGDINRSVETIGFLGDAINKLTSKNEALVKTRTEFEKTVNVFGKSTDLAKLITQFGQVSDLPESAVKKLSKLDQELVQEYQQTNDKIKELRKKQKEATQDALLSVGNIVKADVDEQKRLNDLSATNYEKYVTEIIAKAKKFQTALGKGIDVQLKIAFNDTKTEEFQKSLDYLSKINAGKFTFTIFNPKIALEGSLIPPEEVKPVAKEFGQMFYSELKAQSDAQKNTPTIFPPSQAEQEAKDFYKSFIKELNTVSVGGFSDIISGFAEGLGNLGSGKGFGSGLVDALSGLLKNLGEALIKYGAIKIGIDKIFGAGGFAIPGGVAIGLGIAAIAASKIFQNVGHRATGGPVLAGGSYIVGERGPELFTPNTGGDITANHLLGGRGISGGGMMVQVSGEFLQRGQDLLAVITLANQSKQRLI